MSYEETQIGKLILSDEKKAKKLLLGVVKEAGGNLVHAALKVGVHHATMKRWVNRLGVREEIERIRRTSSPGVLSDIDRARLLDRAARQRREAGLRRVAARLPRWQREEIDGLDEWEQGGLSADDAKEVERKLELHQERKRVEFRAKQVRSNFRQG